MKIIIAYQVILSPIMPDLIIDSVTWSPADFSTGGKVNFDVKVKNQGSDMAGSFRVAYYVDGEIAGYQIIGQLDAGATMTESFSCTAAAGSHAIKIVADSSNQVTESDETNNVKTVNIPPPDLVVQDITCSPAKASVGDKVTVTVTIKNQGSWQSR